MAGVFFGPLIAGQLSDRFGRKPTVLGFFLFLCIFGFGSAFSPNWKTFTAFRFLIGICLGAVISVEFVLATEQLVQKWRLLVFVGGWPLGFMSQAIIAFITLDWKYMSIVINSLGVVPLILSFFIFESPKWLLERNETHKAITVFRKIAALNGRSSENLEKVISESDLFLHEGNEQNATVNYSYWHLFGSCRATVHCMVMVFGWACISLIDYGMIFGIGDLAGDPAMNTLLFGILQFCIQLVVPFVDTKFKFVGRKTLLVVGWVVNMISEIMVIIAFSFGLPSIVVTIFGITGLISAQTTWISLEIYTIELFPTVLRNMGNGLCNTAARIGGILAPQAPLLAGLWKPAPLTVFFFLALINLILETIILPETKGKPLPDLNEKRTNTLMQILV